jgi:hypothetical protein
MSTEKQGTDAVHCLGNKQERAAGFTAKSLYFNLLRHVSL